MKRILCLFLCLQASFAWAIPLDTFTTYVTAHPNEARKGPFAELLARGTGTNDMYVMEVDPATGAIPVSATFSSSDDHNYGVVGSNTLRTAAQIGNATGAAAFGTGTRSAQVLRVTVATDDGLATSAKQDTGNTSLSSIDTKTPSLGQATMAASSPVVIASNQSAVPVSAASLPLPSGAATEATLSTLNGKVANDYGVSSGAVRAAAQVGNASGVADFNTGAAGAQTLRTVLAARSESVSTPLAAQLSNGTTAVDYGSGASGTATIRTVLSTRQESVATPLAAQLSNGTSAIDYGSGASGATTLRVVPSTRSEAAATPLAVRISDGTNFSNPSQAGRSYADSIRNDYTSTSVTTGAWVQLIASTAALINQLYIFDSSGQTLELGTGAGGAETRKLIIPPGGIDGPVNIAIPAGTRVSVRAVSATASVGEIDITGFQ